MRFRVILLMFFISLAIVPTYVRAREPKITIGIGLGLGQLWEGEDSYVMIQPKVGYRFNNRIEAGARVRFDIACFHRAFYETKTAFSYGGYVDYNYFITGSFRFFVSGRAMHVGNKINRGLFDSWNGLDSSSYCEKATNEFGITPGVRCKLRNVPVELTLNYLFLGYMDYEADWSYKDAPGCWGSRWVLDAGLRRLEIGAAVTF